MKQEIITTPRGLDNKVKTVLFTRNFLMFIIRVKDTERNYGLLPHFLYLIPTCVYLNIMDMFYITTDILTNLQIYLTQSDGSNVKFKRLG